MKDLGCDYQVYALSAGATTMLSGQTGSYILLDYSGLGFSNVRRLSQRSPEQQGDTDIGYGIDPRIVNLSWGVMGSSGTRPMADLEMVRQELFSIFRPRSFDPVQMLFITPGGQRRQIDVYLVNDLDLSSKSYEGLYSQRIAAQFKASDPNFYDPLQRTISFDLSALAGGWSIEEDGETTSLGWSIEEDGVASPNGWQIGVGTLGVTQVLTYGDGSPLPAIEYPIIELAGPIANPIIENVTTGEILDFTANGGLAIGVGGTVTIDLRVGKKTIIDQDGAFVDQYLTSGSDLSSWHLSYDSELLPDDTRSTGANTIRVTGTSATLATAVTILWHNRYVGI